VRALTARLLVIVGLAAAAVGAGAAPSTRAASAPPRGAPPAAPSSAPATAAAASAPATEFTGTLSTGMVYVADVAFDGRALQIWRPLREMKVAKNVAWTIEWINLDQFPALKTPAERARPYRFRFRVVKTDSSSGSPVLPWMTTYRCEVLAAEPLASPAPPKTSAPKKR
jgi:hypothetical protein